MNIKRVILITLYVAISSFASAKEVVKNPAMLGEVATKNFSKTIPIQWSGGLPLIEVEIDGKKYHFLFDTAAPTTVPPSLIAKLNSLNQNIDLHDAAGKKNVVNLHTLPSLKVGGIEFKDFAVLVQDFRNSFPVSCLGFDGILGYNMLRDLSVKLELNKNKITLSDKPIEHKGYVAVPIDFTINSGPRVVFKFPFGDGVFEIDTGKNEGVVIGDTSVRTLLDKEKYTYRTISGTFFSSMSGEAKNREAYEYVIKNFSIGNKLKVKSFPFTVDNNHAFLVGDTFLKNFSIIIDFPHNIAYFKALNSDINQSFKASYGITPSWSKQRGFFVSALTSNTPASQSNIAIGDKILKLNNYNTKDMSANDFCKFLIESQDSNISFEKKEILNLTIKKDNNKTYDIKLKKEKK